MTDEINQLLKGEEGRREDDDSIQTRGAKESVEISQRGYSLHELWQNAHLANYNTKNEPVKQRKAKQADLTKSYPLRVNECPFAQLIYNLSEKGEIILRINFPKTGKTFDYYPIESPTIKRKYLDEIEEANEEEGKLALKMAQIPRTKYKLARANPEIKPRSLHLETKSRVKKPTRRKFEYIQQNVEPESLAQIDPSQIEQEVGSDVPPISLEERITIRTEIEDLRAKIERELAAERR